MIKREQDNVRREDIRFGRDTLAWALWRLSLVLRDIAAMDGQAEEPKIIERKEPLCPEENGLTGGQESNASE